jgi:hypothetical protein
VTNLRVALCALVCAGLAVGCASEALPTETIERSAGPTVVTSPSVSPTDAASPSPASLGSVERPLDAGTYRVDLDQLAGGGTGFPAFLATVPDGWHTFKGWNVYRPRSGESADPVAVQFWDVDQVYGHPCQWDGTLFQPGPTVDDLANALVDIPQRNATKPIDVTLDGYAGKYLEWSVPSDMDFSKCDADGDEHHFESWTGKGWAHNRYHQGPGQVDRLWILDIDGSRIVIDAFSMPSASAEEREELLNVVQSIRFER